mgnify:CR=1 FL=1
MMLDKYGLLEGFWVNLTNVVEEQYLPVPCVVRFRRRDATNDSLRSDV